jgi:hypothetical protein
MRGFIEIVDHHGIDTIVNVAHIKTIWRNSLNRTSFHMQGDPIAVSITTNTSYDEFKVLITKSFD